MKAVYTTSNLVEAQAVGDHLAANGVAARVDSNEVLPGLSLPYPAGGYQVRVDRSEDCEKANVLLRDFLEAPAADPDELEHAALATAVEDQSPHELDQPDKPNASEAPEAPQPERPRRELWIEFAVVHCLALLEPLGSGIWHLFHDVEGDSISSLGHSYFLLLGSTATSVPLLYILWRSGENFRTFGLQKPKWFSDIIFGLVFAAILGGGATTIHYVVVILLDLPLVSFGYPRPETPVAWALLVAAQLANGFNEELTMRGYCITRLEQLLGSRWLALLISSGLFASYHIYQGLEGAIGAFCVGLLFGCAFSAQRRLWPLVIGHVVYNLSTVAGM